MWHFFRAHTLR